MKYRWLLTVVVLAVAAGSARAEDVVGSPITPWQPGMLDIHQISTGRGNAGLYIFPDGTTLLVDAGELPGGNPKHTPARPDDTRGAGEWVVRYLRHALRHDPQPALDYVLLTHFHQDHMGEVAPGMPVSAHGYTLTGVTRVVEELKVGKLLDRGWPDYSNATQPDHPFMKNYLAFVKWQTENNGLQVERFVPGRNDQVVLRREPGKYSQFEFRNVGANGEIWTGEGTATDHRMPPLETIPRKKWPDENVFSISFRLSYGKFKFFNGGDIPGIRKNSPAWYDIETPVAKVVGPVDAAILDHHGYLDAMNEFFVTTFERSDLDHFGMGCPSSDAAGVGAIAVGTPLSWHPRRLRHRRASRCTIGHQGHRSHGQRSRPHRPAGFTRRRRLSRDDPRRYVGEPQRHEGLWSVPITLNPH